MLSHDLLTFLTSSARGACLHQQVASSYMRIKSFFALQALSDIGFGLFITLLIQVNSRVCFVVHCTFSPMLSPYFSMNAGKYHTVYLHYSAEIIEVLWYYVMPAWHICCDLNNQANFREDGCVFPEDRCRDEGCYGLVKLQLKYKHE